MANAVKTYFQLETSQYESKLRDATRHLKDMVHDVRAAGGSLNDLSAKTKQTASSFGSFEVGAKNAKDKVRELVAAFNTMSREYNVMTKSMQESDVGRSIAGQLEVLKNRIKEAKKELYDSGDATKGLFDKGGELNGVLGQLGQKLGINSQLMGVITTGTLGYTAAITAATTATIAATKAWADYNSELSKQTNAAMVTTGLKGDDLNKLVDSAKAVSDIYGVDFREVVNSANTLMTQFGKTGDEAMQLIRDGMQGMIQGDGGKLLSMIQQYAPAFQSAGVSASQLVAVIQNSEGGIFSEQNMSAIIMALPKIKMMSENTAKALAGIGIDGRRMAADVESGAITVFDALQTISQAIDENKDKTKETSIVMQDLFGRQARTAGDNLGKAIATLNTNLDETKKQTGSVGQSLANLELANERLNDSLRKTFGYDGWQQMANGISTVFVGALAEAVDTAESLRETIHDVSGIDVFSVMISSATQALGPLGQVLDHLRQIAGIGKLGGGGIAGTPGVGVAGLISGKSGGTSAVTEPSSTEKALQAEIDRLNKLLNAKTTTGGGKTSQAWAPIEMADLTLGTQKVQKVVEVTVDDAAALEQIREIEGVTIADKGMTITATDEALPKLREIEGVKLSDKVVDVVVNDNSDFLFGRSKQDVQKDLQRAQHAEAIAPDEWTRAEARKDVTRYQNELEKMNGEGDVTKGLMKDAYTHDFGKDMDALAKELKNEQKATQLTEVEQVKQMGAMVGGIQQMVGGIAQLGIEIPEGFQSLLGGLQGVMTILQAIQTINTVGSVLGIFGNGGIVGRAANGMVIPGNSFSGDHLRMPVEGGGLIGVNSGELILNKAQQNAVARGLQEDRGGGYSGTPYVDGEKIYLGMNNFLRRSGRGEIVTSRR